MIPAGDPGAPRRIATHYTIAFDRSGRPYAVKPDAYPPDEIAGELPEGWSADFWDWQPRRDPNGQWIELEDKMRSAVWERVKADRAIEREANVDVTIEGRKLKFQADQASIAELKLQLEAARIDPAWPGTLWTTAGNIDVPLDRAGLEAVLLAIAVRRASLHARSQKDRARIFDKDAPLVRTIEDVKAALPRK